MKTPVEHMTFGGSYCCNAVVLPTLVNWWMSDGYQAVEYHCDQCRDNHLSSRADSAHFYDMFRRTDANCWTRVEPILRAEVGDELWCALECAVLTLASLRPVYAALEREAA